MVTSKDVAMKAGVSVSTVSRVFSNPKLISQKVRERVLEAAEELHYIPDSTARNLKLNKRNTIGVIISDSDNPFYIKVLRELNNITKEDMKSFVMFSEEKEELEYADIVSLISSKVQAILFTPASGTNKKIKSLLKSNDVPALQLYRQKFDDMDSLVIDDAYGAYLATKELIKNGHRDIILLDYDLTIPTHRSDGYVRAFEEAGLKYNPNNIVKFTFDDELEETFIKLLKDKKHTAFIPTGSKMIHTLYRCMGDLNLKVKEDISIVAYDDIDMAKYLNLTAISHPFNKIALTANEIIKKRISKPNNEPIHILLKPFLIKRDSIKNINK